MQGEATNCEETNKSTNRVKKEHQEQQQLSYKVGTEQVKLREGYLVRKRSAKKQTCSGRSGGLLSWAVHPSCPPGKNNEIKQVSDKAGMRPMCWHPGTKNAVEMSKRVPTRSESF